MGHKEVDGVVSTPVNKGILQGKKNPPTPLLQLHTDILLAQKEIYGKTPKLEFLCSPPICLFFCH